jgi:hypothetical protein
MLLALLLEWLEREAWWCAPEAELLDHAAAEFMVFERLAYQARRERRLEAVAE